jgi:hypothetical protein
LQIFPNLIINDCKLHVVVNGMVTFWLISTNVNNKLICINKAFTIEITTMKDITLTNASFISIMIITWINAPKNKSMGHIGTCL